MNIVRYSIIATLAGLGVPTGLVAQDKLVARGAAGFSMTVEGTKQGVFPGGKGGGITGVRFSYLLKSPRDAASGQASGKRQHGSVVFTKVVGTASPQLFQAVTSNEVLKSVAIDLPSGEGGGYTIKLSNAAVSEIKQYTETLNGQTVVLEDVSFTFQKIEVEDRGTRSMAMDDWMAGK
ncbi:MAG: type VI secretion system tube protein Hcp [Gemmatimonadaceae bacterium]|nr:type VI secretion system tube protein Hcp [Gloeobacterales cyanobacterium ES-bin-141]